MQRFEEDSVINRPIELVFAHLTDLKNVETWAVFRSESATIEINESKSEVVHRQRHTPPIHLVTDGPLGVGTMLIQSNNSPSQPMVRL